METNDPIYVGIIAAIILIAIVAFAAAILVKKEHKEEEDTGDHTDVKYSEMPFIPYQQFN